MKGDREITVYTTSYINDGNYKVQPGNFCVVEATELIGEIEEIFVDIVTNTVYLSLSMFDKIDTINKCEVIEASHITDIFCWNETFPAKVVRFNEKIVYNVWW